MGRFSRLFGFFRFGAKRRARQAAATAQANADAGNQRAESEARYAELRRKIEGRLYAKDEPKMMPPELLRPFWLLDEITMCDGVIQSGKVRFRRFRAKTDSLNVPGGVTTSQTRKLTIREKRKGKNYGGATAMEEAEREIAAMGGPTKLIRGMGGSMRRYTRKEVRAAKADRAGYIAELGQEAQKLNLKPEQLVGLYEVYRAQRGLATGPSPEGRKRLEKAA